jgi:hypothetical protein
MLINSGDFHSGEMRQSAFATLSPQTHRQICIGNYSGYTACGSRVSFLKRSTPGQKPKCESRGYSQIAGFFPSVVDREVWF